MQVSRKLLPPPQGVPEIEIKLVLTAKERHALSSLMVWAMKRGPSLADQGITPEAYNLLEPIHKQLKG